MAVAEHDFGVGADIDEEGDIVARVGRFGEDHAGGIGADMAGDQRQGVDEGPRRDGKPEVAGGRIQRLVDSERERRAAELDRVEAEIEVMHDRVADRGHLDDQAGSIPAPAATSATSPATASRIDAVISRSPPGLSMA